MTVFPEKYSDSASAMRPAFGARTVVPRGLGKSAPPCGLRASPLKMLRVPKRLFAGWGTGRTNGAVQSRSAADDCQTAFSRFVSRSIRCRSDSGGFTNAGSTARRRVGNWCGLTVKA